jgi:predicted nucleic acid-binding protein
MMPDPTGPTLHTVYADFPLGTTDASVIAVAERLGATEIATLDHRHFRAVRPTHIASFTLLP